MPVFLDTNVLVYAFDGSESAKRKIALQLLADPAREFVISAQVLSEFFVATTTKLDPPLDIDDAREAVTNLRRLPVVAIDDRLVADAIDLAEANRISLWDAQVVRAAARAGCAAVLTEDLNHGQNLAGVEIINPFATT